MELNAYQHGCTTTWIGPNKETRAVMSLAEEAGEAVGKYQKYLRGDYEYPEMKEKIRKELGDILFYVAITAYELGITLDDIAFENQAKLKSRQERNVLKGSGDER